MKYFKLNSDVHCFEDNGSQDYLIEEAMVPMTADEIDRHVNPQKYMSAEEKRKEYLLSIQPLTRRQFKLILLKHDLLDKVSEGLAKIEDKTLRMQAQIEFEDSTMFERLNPTLLLLYKAMGISESKLDSMWEEGLKL